MLAELRAVGALIGHLVGNDQVVFDIHRRLDIVAHHAAPAAACGHGAGIGIGQGDLLVRCRKPQDLELFQALHLLLQDLDLVFQTIRVGRPGKRRLLPVGTIQLVQIAGNRDFDLFHAPLHLRGREVAVAIVHRLELGAINRNAGLGEELKPTAQSTTN